MIIENKIVLLHRATGVALAIGALVFVGWLLAVAGSADSFELVRGFFAAWYGQVILFGFTACLAYHLFNGLRHLAWDIGKGFDIPDVYKSGYAVIVLTVLTTAGIWWVALSAAGGAA